MNRVDWFKNLRASGIVRRQFPGGAPTLSGLQLLRVVIGRGHITVALAYPALPEGVSPKWKEAGYDAIDLIFRLRDVTILALDAAHLAQENGVVNAALEPGELKMRNCDGELILHLQCQTVDAEFVPDPFMQKLLAERDSSGTEIEPNPTGG